MSYYYKTDRGWKGPFQESRMRQWFTSGRIPGYYGALGALKVRNGSQICNLSDLGPDAFAGKAARRPSAAPQYNNMPRHLMQQPAPVQRSSQYYAPPGPMRASYYAPPPAGPPGGYAPPPAGPPSGGYAPPPAGPPSGGFGPPPPQMYETPPGPSPPPAGPSAAAPPPKLKAPAVCHASSADDRMMQDSPLLEARRKERAKQEAQMRQSRKAHTRNKRLSIIRPEIVAGSHKKNPKGSRGTRGIVSSVSGRHLIQEVYGL